nr:MAG TPA: hypothetical protein [Caudoviricetes sp.]
MLLKITLTTSTLPYLHTSVLVWKPTSLLYYICFHVSD